MEAKEVKIKVKGFDAWITNISLTPSGKLGVVVEFEKPAHGLKVTLVKIPAKEYSKDKLIARIIKEAEKTVGLWRRAEKQRELQREERLCLNKLVENLNVEIGLK